MTIAPEVMRNASLNDILPYLQRAHETKYDVVVPSTHLRYQDGQVVVKEGATSITGDGVDLIDARLAPTAHFDAQIGERLEVPYRYMQKMRTSDELGLLDTNINTWLGRTERNFLLRGFRELDPESVGVARALLSDRYQIVDHIDSVTAVLDGVNAAGVDPQTLEVTGDLSPKRLRIKIVAPEITARAPKFLETYRNPWTGATGDDRIAAGLVMTNSEVGVGAWYLAPYVTIILCTNGMTRVVDSMRRIHLGSQMEMGAIEMSEATARANVDLIRNQAADAVTAFLSEGYIENVANELDDKGSKVLERPHVVVDAVGQRMGYSEDERAVILDLFTRGGDTKSGGLVNAFTAYARDHDDPDRAIDIEAQAFDLLEEAIK